MKKIPSILKTAALVATLFLGVGYTYAWNAPTATPPGDNISTPLNVGITDQTKEGDVCTTKGGPLKCLSSGGFPAATAAGQTVRWDGSAWGTSAVGDILVNGITVGLGGGGAGSTAVGESALAANTTGNSMTAIGYGALAANTTGESNTAVGVNALLSNINGYFNVAIGQGTLKLNQNGADNNAFGYQALVNNISGNSNDATGVYALHQNTIGSNNDAYGREALSNNTSGGQNAAFGRGALTNNITGSQNTAVGAWADVTSSALTNATAIGYGAGVDASNKVRIGNSAVTSIVGAVNFLAESDSRLKENVVDYTHGLDFITKLRPVSYNLKADGTHKTHNGFIAQEVEATGIPFYGINKPETTDGYYSLSYAEFVVPLVNSVKELKAENDKLRVDNDNLRVRLERLEAKMK